MYNVYQITDVLDIIDERVGFTLDDGLNKVFIHNDYIAEVVKILTRSEED